MKFKQYLTESSGKTSFEDILNLIINNCQPFLKECKQSCGKNPRFLFSGRSGDKDYFIRNVRKNRTPMDMPEDAHDAFDDAFHKKFGIKARSNSIFVTGSKYMAENYGDTVYAIFPIGKYKYLWSPKFQDLYSGTNDGEDVYLDDDDGGGEEIEDLIQIEYEDKYGDDESPEIEFDEYKYEVWDDFMDRWAKTKKEEIDNRIITIINTYKTINLNAAILSYNEIMLNCKKYLAINYDIYGEYLYHYLKYGDTKDVSRESLEKFFKKNKSKLKGNSRLKASKFRNPE